MIWYTYALWKDVHHELINMSITEHIYTLLKKTLKFDSYQISVIQHNIIDYSHHAIY